MLIMWQREKRGVGLRGKILVDGPVDVSITGDLVTLRGSSDGQVFALVFRVEDALISAFRFKHAHEEAIASRAENTVLSFPARRHAADTV